MTQESFQQIKELALQMAGEVEWADFPLLDDVACAVTRDIFAGLVGDWPFQEEVRHVLVEQLFVRVAPIVPQLPDHQEPEQQAGGLVQAAMKSVLCRRRPELAHLYHQLLCVKFRKLSAPMIQAPIGVVHVPSMASQRRRARLEGML